MKVFKSRYLKQNCQSPSEVPTKPQTFQKYFFAREIRPSNPFTRLFLSFFPIHKIHFSLHSSVVSSVQFVEFLNHPSIMSCFLNYHYYGSLGYKAPYFLVGGYGMVNESAEMRYPSANKYGDGYAGGGWGHYDSKRGTPRRQ